MTVGQPPSPRGNPSCVVAGGHLVVYGGWNGEERLGDVVALNLDTWEWHRPLESDDAEVREMCPLPCRPWQPERSLRNGTTAMLSRASVISHCVHITRHLADTPARDGPSSARRRSRKFS